MLSAENENLLRPARRRSAISQALRAISADLNSEPASWDLFDDLQSDKSFHIQVANNRETRQRAYTLAARMYSSCGYCPENVKCLVNNYDVDPKTMTLLVEDENGRDAATVTLVFDSSTGLPADEIYHAELDGLRAQSRQLAEVCRMAIAKEYQRSKFLLVRLFNLIIIYCRRVCGFDNIVIEVRPPHASYHQRTLGFEIVGSVRPCTRANGTLAVLSSLDLAFAEREIRRVGGTRQAPKDRTLYPYFYSFLEEGAAAEFMAQQHRPMSDEDKLFFGLVSGATSTAGS